MNTLMLKKFAFGLSLLCTLCSAHGQIDFEEVKTSAIEMISLHKLNCSVRLGSNIPEDARHATILEGFFIGQRAFPKVHFEHKLATAQGCERGLLDKLVDDSFMRFNHAQATVTLIQRRARNPRMYRGQCMRNIQEQVEIDFEQGTVLKTNLLGKLIPATGC